MTVVDGLPVPVDRRYVTPRQPAPGPPKHSVDHSAVIGPPATPLRGLVRQKWFQPRPFLIGQIMAIEHEVGLPHPQIKIRGTRADMEAVLSRGVGKRCPWPSPWAPLRSPDAMLGGDERVGVRRDVSLICAGWLPQDGLFDVSGTAV